MMQWKSRYLKGDQSPRRLSLRSDPRADLPDSSRSGRAASRRASKQYVDPDLRLQGIGRACCVPPRIARARRALRKSAATRSWTIAAASRPITRLTTRNRAACKLPAVAAAVIKRAQSRS